MNGAVGERRAVRIARAVLPGAIFLGVRGVGVAVLAMMATAHGQGLAGRLGAWDAHWFLGLAQGGYDGVPAGLADAFGVRTAETPLAFFPGYPGVLAALAFLSGLPLLTAGVVATLASGVVAAHGVARLGELVPGGSREAGLILAALFAASPMSVVFVMAYSEALFCALAAWALVALLHRRWLLAGALSALAGLVRPTAAALVAAVVLAAAVAIVRRQDGRRPWAGAVLAPLGLLGYLGWVAARTGSPTGWFDLQRRGWESRFDGGGATVAFARDALASGRSVMEVGTVAVLLAGLVLLVVCLRRAAAGLMPWPLVVYAAVVVGMDVGSNGLMGSKARLLLPALTLLVPVAADLARRRPGTTAGVLVAAVLAAAWFGAYALTAWPYAI